MNKKYRMTPKSFITYKGVKQECHLKIEIELPGAMSESEAIHFLAGMLGLTSNAIHEAKELSAEALKKNDIIFQEIKS